MTNVLIVDDHPVVRRGLKQILSQESDFRNFGEASNGREALNKIREQNWDAVILDINLPDRNGLDVLRDLKNVRPKLPVLVLSIHSEDQIAVRVLKSDASGYLNKDSAPEELVNALRKVLSGGKYISLSLAEKIAYDLEPDAEMQPHQTLSDREYQIACMIAGGKTVKEIAEKLYLSIKTVSAYRARIFKKMNLKTNAELIHYAIKNNLID